jgi:hypothetical protein
MWKSDHMTNSYSISRKPWKWRSYYSTLWNWTIPNRFIALPSNDSKLSHQLFRSKLVWDVIQEIETVLQTQVRRQQTQAPPNTALKRLDTWRNRHYPFEGKRIWCHVCSSKHKETRMKLKYPECNVGLCASQCLEVHHIIQNFWGTNDTKL